MCAVIMTNDIYLETDFKKCGCSSAVEHRLPKPRVAGSNPVARSYFLFYTLTLKISII